MNNVQALKLVDAVFADILRARSADEISAIVFQRSDLHVNRLDRKNYPELRLSINSDEIATLVSDGLLTDEGELHPRISARTLSPLEKLLYSVAWKNGDLPKVTHIVEGVRGVHADTARKKGPGQVFHQFGRHLADKREPIIDQHVLRAFLLWRADRNDEKKMDSIRRITLLNNQVSGINDYKSWLKTECFDPQLKESADYLMHIDSTLFALGKTIKLGKCAG